MTSLIYLVFLLSGISGLVYQVIWVREFGQMFGNTVQSASLVTAIFTLGLGLGSYFAGPFIDRKNESDPKAGLRYYAYAELLIGALALVVALVTPQLERLSPLISRYARGEHGWFELTAMSYFWRYLVAVVCVGPITVLMGATLTFLVRFVLSRSLEQAGRKIGVLYGMNTLGAAIGCALVDLWAVPAIGLMHTRTIAVALNVIAGSSALCLARTLKELALKAAAPPPATPTAVPVTAENRKRWLTYAGTAIAISGFCAMGM
jgi:spermidine synthase